MGVCLTRVRAGVSSVARARGGSSAEPAADNMEAAFKEVHERMSAEEQLKKEIRERRDLLDTALEAPLREVSAAHHVLTDALPELVARLFAVLPPVGEMIRQMLLVVPPGEFYKYLDFFRNQMQTAVFVTVLAGFLEAQVLADVEQVKMRLGLDASSMLAMDDYLIGLCMMVSELARLTVNRVTEGDYAFAQRVSKFAFDVHQGFRSLNFRNDSVRRKYDGMKYDIKKIEDVMYDLSVRNLLPK